MTLPFNHIGRLIGLASTCVIKWHSSLKHMQLFTWCLCSELYIFFKWPYLALQRHSDSLTNGVAEARNTTQNERWMIWQSKQGNISTKSRFHINYSPFQHIKLLQGSIIHKANQNNGHAVVSEGLQLNASSSSALQMLAIIPFYWFIALQWTFKFHFWLHHVWV